jgi:hypothetical protein
VRPEGLRKLKNIIRFIGSRTRDLPLLHRHIDKFTWTSSDGKNHNQIDLILIDSRRYSSVSDVG